MKHEQNKTYKLIKYLLLYVDMASTDTLYNNDPKSGSLKHKGTRTLFRHKLYSMRQVHFKKYLGKIKKDLFSKNSMYLLFFKQLCNLREKLRST